MKQDRHGKSVSAAPRAAPYGTVRSDVVGCATDAGRTIPPPLTADRRLFNLLRCLPARGPQASGFPGSLRARGRRAASGRTANAGRVAWACRALAWGPPRFCRHSFPSKQRARAQGLAKDALRFDTAEVHEGARRHGKALADGIDEVP